MPDSKPHSTPQSLPEDSGDTGAARCGAAGGVELARWVVANAGDPDIKNSEVGLAADLIRLHAEVERQREATDYWKQDREIWITAHNGLQAQLETLRADLYAVWDNPKIAHADQWFYDIAEKYGWALEGSNPHSEVKACEMCGLHPYDFDVSEYEREVKRLEEQLETYEIALKAITQTDWHGEGWSKETPFQFEQRIHKIAADALMGLSVTYPATEASERDETVARPIPDARVSAHDSRSEASEPQRESGPWGWRTTYPAINPDAPGATRSNPEPSGAARPVGGGPLVPLRGSKEPLGSAASDSSPASEPIVVREDPSLADYPGLKHAPNQQSKP